MAITRSASHRRAMSLGMKRFWRRKRATSAKRSLSARIYWLGEDSNRHRRALSRGMKRYWANQ